MNFHTALYEVDDEQSVPHQYLHRGESRVCQRSVLRVCQRGSTRLGVARGVGSTWLGVAQRGTEGEWVFALPALSTLVE